MKILKWFLIATLTAVCTHFTLLLATPYLMMGAVNVDALVQEKHGKLVIVKAVIAGEDKVVRSSPDLLYSACVFDLSDGPYRISAPAMDSYMSVSFFGHNTDNFLAINDRQAPQGINIVLAKTGESIELPVGVPLVETDSPYGLSIGRINATSDLINEFQAELGLQSSSKTGYSNSV